MEETMPAAFKSVKQHYQPTPDVLEMLETFRRMVNDCIGIGFENNVSTRGKLTKLAYHTLHRYRIMSYYKVCAIAQAVGILESRRKSMRRGQKPGRPYVWKPHLESYWGFSVVNGVFKMSIGDNRRKEKQYLTIPLNEYVKACLAEPGVDVRSFALTPAALVISFSKEAESIEPESAAGVDRNLANITYGNHERVITFDVSKAVDIAENTRSIVRSFRRNDVRVRKKIAGKYGRRRQNRVHQLLHKVSKAMVQDAKARKAAIVFEDITFIRKLYQRGNGQGRDSRGRMNSWPFHELKRQVEYKAAWEGVKVITLTKAETRGTSQLCPQCGERTQEDRQRRRELWCPNCRRWMDRDVVAAMNIAYRGRLLFSRPQGAAGEAMVQEPGTPVILRVDAAKPILDW